MAGTEIEREHDMTEIIEDIRSAYARLIRNEDEAARALTRARADLETAREADIEAYAESALAGEEPPKRKEVRLRHAIENLEVAAKGYDVAYERILADAIAAVGEGRRELSKHEQAFLRRRVAADDEARTAAWRGEVEPASVRPEDLIAFVTEQYEAADRRHEANEVAKYEKEGYQRAIAAVERAKSEHVRRGKEPGTFRISRYEDIVTPELQRFLSSTPGKGAMQNASRPSDEVPWPGSLQDLQQNAEPQATPA
jgi:hypothetical protein